LSNNIQISLCASANRHTLQNGLRNWERFMNSLRGNKINIEVIFVGNSEPPYKLPDNFKFIYANVKPAQCYQIAFWHAQGELVGWTADDADYNHPKLNCPNSLDIAYEFYKRCEDKYKDNKTVIAMRPIEDGGDVQERWHYFFGGCKWSPRMAPFGLINREYFLNVLGSYDRNFISGQSENDVVMRVYEDGGRVEFCREAFLYVYHKMVHPRDSRGREDNKFRKYYNEDRKVLETAWVREGYGHYERYTPEQLQKIVHISDKRLVPFQPFENNENVYYKSQGAKGDDAPWN